jgi:hypothetical protein
MRDFGLIQSTAQLIGRDEWENFFSHIGLHIQQTIDINKTLQYHKPNYNELELLSKNYSTKLRHRSYLNPIALIKTLWYQLKLHLSHRDDYKHLENIIFIMKA